MSSFYLGLGSNQGNRLSNLKDAIAALQTFGTLLATSSVYETEPKYELSQPEFLNMVCAVESKLSALELFAAVKSVEQKLGRIMTFRNGPRVIDIDILFSPQESCNTPSLQIPHPRLAERAFVLVPLNEIASDCYLPQLGKVSDLLSRLDKMEISEVKLYFVSSPNRLAKV